MTGVRQMIGAESGGRIDWTIVLLVEPSAGGQHRGECHAQFLFVEGLEQARDSALCEQGRPHSLVVTGSDEDHRRMLSAQPANVDGARETAVRTIRDGERAADDIARLRKLYIRKDLQSEPMDLNEAAREVVSLSLNELQRDRVIVRNELTDGLLLVNGDRIQLQQVILNLLRNAADAMRTIEDRPRELFIRTEADDADGVRLSVSDSGIGLAPGAAERTFEPFYTTKSDGMGIGLSVSRSIIDAHHGRLWATPNEGPGVTFAFRLPRR
jgi:signal transduction histidine kinase